MKERLYNKYRQSLNKFHIGQNFEISKLRGIIKNKVYEYSREFIITSESGGVGKSTLARILAMAINCDNPQDGEPCHQCDSCKKFIDGKYSDFIGINGADYNTIEKIKPVTDMATKYPNDPNKFRIVVIDEFQRVNPHAQSEFLDLLEFGKNRTIFIFTTTKEDSILQPIKTRCDITNLSNITPSDIKNKLMQICNNENIDYDMQTLSFISNISNGSLRDAIKMVEIYSKSFGSLTDIRIPTNHDQIFTAVVDAINGKIDEDELYKIKYNSLKDHISKVLFDIKIGKSDIIDSSLFSKYYLLINMEIDNVIDKFLKYRPDDMQSFILWLTTISSSKKEIETVKRKNGRNFITNKNVSKILTNNGFKKV